MVSSLFFLVFWLGNYHVVAMNCNLSFTAFFFPNIASKFLSMLSPRFARSSVGSPRSMETVGTHPLTFLFPLCAMTLLELAACSWFPSTLKSNALFAQNFLFFLHYLVRVTLMRLIYVTLLPRLLDIGTSFVVNIGALLSMDVITI